MSNVSMIFVKVKNEDIGKTMCPDKQLIYAQELRISDIGGNKLIPETEIDKVQPVVLDKEYIGIYHHWDGFPGGVGNALVKYFNSYETALNLMLYGGESDITDGSVIIPYTLRGGGYKKMEDMPPVMYDKIPPDLGKTQWAGYVYLFKDGEWYYDTASKSARKKYSWKKLRAF